MSQQSEELQLNPIFKDISHDSTNLRYFRLVKGIDYKLHLLQGGIFDQNLTFFFFFLRGEMREQPINCRRSNVFPAFSDKKKGGAGYHGICVKVKIEKKNLLKLLQRERWCCVPSYLRLVAVMATWYLYRQTGIWATSNPHQAHPQKYPIFDTLMYGMVLVNVCLLFSRIWI